MLYIHTQNSLFGRSEKEMFFDRFYRFLMVFGSKYVNFVEKYFDFVARYIVFGAKS